MIIEDGAGTGRAVEVNLSNQLEVRSVVVGRAEWECHNNARAYVMYFSQAAANAAANECLGYLKNDSSTEDLVIDEVGIHITAANTIYMSKVTGTATGGTVVVPTNFNLGSTLVAVGTFLRATAIGGLTDAGRLINTYVPANGYLVRTPICSILLVRNSAVGIYVTTQQVQTLNCSVVFHYEDKH
jgi:hypothetical protein